LKSFSAPFWNEINKRSSQIIPFAINIFLGDFETGARFPNPVLGVKHQII